MKIFAVINILICKHLSAFLIIQGKHLDIGGLKDQYIIRIGGGICNDVTVFTNYIECQPPEKEPDSINNTRQHKVEVRNNTLIIELIRLHI